MKTSLKRSPADSLHGSPDLPLQPGRCSANTSSIDDEMDQTALMTIETAFRVD